MDHTRHSNIFNVPSYYNVGLVGAGGLGATTALTLAKMGVVQLTVWDDDVVSTENIATQLHPVSGVGDLKVATLVETLENFSDEILPLVFNERVDEQTRFEHFDLLISAVDSITARKQIWDAIYRNEKPTWYLDMRMSAREYQHFLVNMSDRHSSIHNYAALLESLDENDVAEVPCTEKSTFFCAMTAAGHVGNVLCNILRNEVSPHRLVHYIPQNVIQVFKI